MTTVTDEYPIISNYEDLKEFLFDESKINDWYFSDEFEEPEFTWSQLPMLITELYSDTAMLKSVKNHTMLYHGLNYTLNTSCSDFGYICYTEAVEDKFKYSYIDSIYALFEGLFNDLCENKLSHLEVEQRGDNYKPISINMLCYMWWDVFPRHGTPYKSSLKEIDLKILDCLAKILKLESLACKESALHGLGHWAHSYPELVEKTIQSSQCFIPDSLIEYSKKASTGDIQ